MASIKISNQELEEIVKAIVKETNPQKIVLFGSGTNGYIEEDSDLDILVVAENSEVKRNRREMISKIRNSLEGIRFPKDILLYSIDEVEYWKDSVNHIIANAIREGQVLYERH